MKVYNIKWVTDDADVHLPIEVDVSRTLTEFEIADFLSDTYGFLVESFDIF